MNNEKEILGLIADKFGEEAQNASVPESLEKDNVVAMLKASSGKVVNLSAKSEIEKYTRTINALKRVVAVAAALMVVLITALFLNTRNNISVFSMDEYRKKRKKKCMYIIYKKHNYEIKDIS